MEATAQYNLGDDGYNKKDIYPGNRQAKAFKQLIRTFGKGEQLHRVQGASPVEE